MKKTRILSVVAVLCLLLGMFAGAAVAEETPELKKIGVAFMKNDPFMVPLPDTLWASAPPRPSSFCVCWLWP